MLISFPFPLSIHLTTNIIRAPFNQRIFDEIPPARRRNCTGDREREFPSEP